MDPIAYLFLATGFEECEFVAPLDILRRGGVKALSVSITDEYEVEGANGLVVKADLLLRDLQCDDAAMLVLPGGMPGAANLRACDELREIIMAAYERQVKIAAICAAPMVFGALGLLEGKRAACYPGFEGELGGAEYTNAPCVTDGLITTGRSPGYAYDFGYSLLALLMGQETAQQVRSGMFP